jgi:hypothetical protein
MSLDIQWLKMGRIEGRLEDESKHFLQVLIKKKKKKPK